MSRDDDAPPEVSYLEPHSLTGNLLDPLKPGVVFRLLHAGEEHFPEMAFEDAVSMWRDLGDMLAPFLSPFPSRRAR